MNMTTGNTPSNTMSSSPSQPATIPAVGACPFADTVRTHVGKTIRQSRPFTQVACTKRVERLPKIATIQAWIQACFPLASTDLSAEEREHVIAGTLVKREGSPEHVAHAVLFLLENDFVTGVCLPVDGGRTINS